MSVSSKSCSLHTSTAIDTQHLAIDPFAILAGQEAHDASNVNGQTDAMQGRPSSSKLVHLLIAQLVAVGNVLAAHGMVHVRLDAAGRHGVDRDLFVLEVYARQMI